MNPRECFWFGLPGYGVSVTRVHPFSPTALLVLVRVLVVVLFSSFVFVIFVGLVLGSWSFFSLCTLVVLGGGEAVIESIG